MTGVNIGFPNIGIYLENVPSGFTVFGFRIAFYGVIIAVGMILGYLVAEWQAKRTGQNPDLYLDFALIAIPVSVICARIYYVIFSWDLYRDNIWDVFNTRNGGLAIYGGVIGAIATAFLFARVKKIKFGLLSDTGCLGLITGQIIGRWGNFFNCEAFGGYAGGSLFAMKLPWDVAKSHMSLANALAMEKYVVADSILVHPTFLYESVWNFILLLVLIWYSPRKKFDGEVILLYMVGYGIGRFWIEGIRTDQLLLWNTAIPASMALSALLVIAALIAIVGFRMKEKQH
ncbi:MAG: phosphatidylglycerol---prolipoprotein diacylglyceryl transferase [Clostridiales bacterium]|nr:phosphatidylglycerol---prolipoprotein diacylglyceryl transferase [Clostridiales bacterium]